LTDYEFTAADKLSGGNKRKLCVALALMGGTNM
jgi:ATP-binding cassette subfamily A (ABC1) protein 3